MLKIIIKVALREIRGALTRSLLTMLGVIIGVASVVAMVSLGEGAKRDVVGKIKNLGTNLLIVRPGLLERGHVRRAPAQTLTLDDAELVKKHVAGIRYVAPSVYQNAQIKYFARNTATNIIGVTPEYLEARGFAVGDGRFITAQDVAGARRVVALGSEVADKLFSGLPAIGNMVKINGVNFQVVAIMAEKGEMGWYNADDQVLIPISAFQRRLVGVRYINEIAIEVQDEKDMDYVMDHVVKLLRKSHHLMEGEENDFHVRSQLEIIKSMEEITRTFTYLLGGTAAISLLVGGIGIMNIMLVTVTERTREIGLRKAIGARRSDILKQFLVESTTLSGVGGVIGVLFGYGVSHMIGRFSQWETYVSPQSVILAYSVALFVGIFFGWYPAWKASKLNPVDALRRE
ncbi:MAG: ABC transporter permease [Nitrospinae bacterium]|nr:ABC transporter permease [Nitrospinota bacterium]